MRLTAGPHMVASEREREGGKRAADTWNREGAGVHLAVAHRAREPAEQARDAGWVRVNGSGPIEIRK
jgi:hypothetical protein